MLSKAGGIMPLLAGKFRRKLLVFCADSARFRTTVETIDYHNLPHNSRPYLSFLLIWLTRVPKAGGKMPLLAVRFCKRCSSSV
jgi:hypothetical protein